MYTSCSARSRNGRRILKQRGIVGNTPVANPPLEVLMLGDLLEAGLLVHCSLFESVEGISLVGCTVSEVKMFGFEFLPFSVREMTRYLGEGLL